MIRSWQIQFKLGVNMPEEHGRWMASQYIDGHITGITRRSHLTKEAAEAAFSAYDCE